MPRRNSKVRQRHSLRPQSLLRRVGSRHGELDLDFNFGVASGVTASDTGSPGALPGSSGGETPSGSTSSRTGRGRSRR
jgi:hypothetical protein